MSNRRTIASSLLLVLALPLLFLSFLQLKQAYIRHEMEERMEKGLQLTLFISKRDLKRHNSRELWVDGRLFDVENIQKTAGGFVVTGLFDDAETAVLKQIQNTCARQTSRDSPVFARFFRLLHGLFTQEIVQESFVADHHTEVFQNPIPELPLRCKTVLVPPPQPVM